MKSPLRRAFFYKKNVCDDSASTNVCDDSASTKVCDECLADYTSFDE